MFDLLDIFKALKLCSMSTNRIENLIIATTTMPLVPALVKTSCDTMLTLLDNEPLTPEVFQHVLKWIESAIFQTEPRQKYNFLCVLKKLLNMHMKFIVPMFEYLLCTKKSVLFHHLDRMFIPNDEENEFLSEEVAVIVDIFEVCIECNMKQEKFNPEMQNIYENVADYVLRIHFTMGSLLKKSSSFLYIVVSSITLLSKILAAFPIYGIVHIGELLGLIKAYMHFGLPDSNALLIHKLHESQQYLYTLRDESLEDKLNIAGGKIQKTRKPRVLKHSRIIELTDNFFPVFNNSILTGDYNNDIKTRESYTESEGNCNINYSNVRIAALSMMSVLLKILDKHILYGYWYAFFPSDSTCREGILHVAISDPNIRCRITSLQLASQMIFGAKKLLEQAETSDKPECSNFLSFSLSLGETVLIMYNNLTQCLTNEGSIPVLIHVIKCLALLVQTTPFHRLRTGFVCTFVKPIRKLICHKDASIQCSALMVIEFLLSTHTKTEEISEVIGIPIDVTKTVISNQNQLNSIAIDANDVEFLEILDSDDDESVHDNMHEPKRRSQNNEMPWILKIALDNLRLNSPEHKISASVRIESLQVITAMSAHFSVLVYKLDLIALALQTTLLDSLPDVRLYASKCLDSIGYNMNKYLMSYDTCINTELEHSQDFWIRMLPTAKENISDKKQTNTLKVFLCDFLSNIGVIIFNRLTHYVQINLLGFLSGIASDVAEDSIVRATAIRALAVFVLFPSMRHNLVFVENTAELAIPLIFDKNLLVRIKSLWSIGNVSDALISNRGQVYNERVSNKLLIRLINVTFEACSDNDKVRCNAVRALGNLMQLLNDEMMNDFNMRHLFQNVVRKLIDCIKTPGNAKVKWNACFAFGCLIKNNSIFKAISGFEDFTWHKLMFPTLCLAIVNNENFKVRINATIALTNIQNRSFFYEYFELCWSSLLCAVEKSYDLANFLEYNHRDYLQERLCIAISHIILLASNDDCLILKKELVTKIEIVKETWFRVVNRMTPESAASLLSCPVLLENRCQNGSLSVEQRSAIQFIKNAFFVMNT